jgi:hypothetical protein
MVYPSSIDFEGGKVPLDFQPTAHIFYESRFAVFPHLKRPLTLLFNII